MATLSDEQVAFFHEFGFLIFRQLLGADEVETIAREAAVAIEETYQGRDGGNRGRWAPLQRPSTPFSASLLEDPRFYGMATELFDDSLIGLMSDMLVWLGDTGWHRDQDVPGNTGLKFLYYFDPLTTETGCLRVVPGSHLELDRNEVGDVEPVRLTSGQDHYMQVVSELAGPRHAEVPPDQALLPPVAVETIPGDVIVFALPLLHASFGGAPNRRIGSSIYWAPPGTPELAEARCREAGIIQSNHHRMFNYPPEAPFAHPDWIARAEGNPVRERWVACLRDLEWIPRRV
ncbi:MAG: phytanoyl-CoA dioxygenase family protein [Spirochaetaceae bacterium]|nr:phytanoyl-CoA dioxygenase family protein [Spirochaetaceae bacterium]